LVEAFGHGIGQVDQDSIQQPGGPPWQRNTIVRTDPEVGQTPQPFDDVVGIFDPPTLPIQGYRVEYRQALAVQFVSQVAIPLALVQHLDQAQPLALILLADPRPGFLSLGCPPQRALDDRGQIALGASDEGKACGGQLGIDAESLNL